MVYWYQPIGHSNVVFSDCSINTQNNGDDDPPSFCLEVIRQHYSEHVFRLGVLEWRSEVTKSKAKTRDQIVLKELHVPARCTSTTMLQTVCTHPYYESAPVQNSY